MALWQMKHLIALWQMKHHSVLRTDAQRRKAQADWDARQAKQDTADEQADSALPTNAEEPECQTYRPPGAKMGRSMTRREKAQANWDA
jgi:hypothetical protein